MGGLAAIIVLCMFPLFQTRDVMLFFFAAFGILSVVATISLYRHYRLIHDLPTSRIASAAQGFVEIVGRTAMLPGAPLAAPLSGKPCCWYSFTLNRQYRRDDGGVEWGVADHGSSTQPFLIVDDTGVCAILPEDASLAARTDLIDSATWRDGDRLCHESLLPPGIVAYAAGEFVTSGNAAAAGLPKLSHAEVVGLIDEFRVAQARLRERHRERASSADVRELLAAWKKDRARLHERFDADRDGTIDTTEWERARLEARREVQRHHVLRQEAPRRPGADPAVEGLPTLRKPRDGRPFVLADEIPESMDKRVLFGGWVFFFVSLYFVAGFILALW